MIARTNSSACRAPCTPPIRRTRPNSLFACSQVQRLLQKQSARRFRAPLALKSPVNGVLPAQTAPVVPCKKTISLPRTLPRPTLREVNTSSIEAAFPELAGVTPEYIRARLPIAGTHMLAAISNIQACPPKSSLPKELEIVMNDMVAAACPTHMLAVYSAAAPSPSQKRKVTLFPAHQLVLAAHCANLPVLPPTTPSTSASTTTTLPVVPLCLPSPEAFPMLQTYLYTKQPASLLSALVPSPRPTDVLALTRQAMMIHGLWQNACALGVVDSQLFDIIDEAWEGVVSALALAHSS